MESLSDDNSREFILNNLVELCNEILEWRATGILKGEKLKMLAALYNTYNPDNALRLAEARINRFAMLYIIATEKDAVTFKNIIKNLKK